MGWSEGDARAQPDQGQPAAGRQRLGVPTGRAPPRHPRTPDLKGHYERVEAELPVAGQDWPWGDPHTYPHDNHWSTLGALSELLPQAGNRVTLADEADAHGMPIARLDYSQCNNDRANITAAKRALERIWEAAGAQDTLTIDRYAHLVGGCRMGSGAADSVIDSDHRVWGLDNLLIADGSVMPTQGAANPALTIMALSSRLAARLAAGRVPAHAARAAA